MSALPSELAPIEVSKLTPLDDGVLVVDMNFGERKTSGGIVLLGDDAKLHGVRPRWGKVYAIGPNQEDIQVGQWILISHGRWTRGVKIMDSTGTHTVRKIDVNDILAVSDEEVIDENMGDCL
jgi:co-chaperonin GroES (HSP10)